jgi:tRNA dimethylallyltransferase
LVAETKQLLPAGLEQNVAAMQAIGYRQVVEHLRGERDLTDTMELVKTKTRQFAKRQMTWFRRQLTLQWIELTAASDPQVIADDLAARYAVVQSRRVA